jgi:hypothetical protein
VYLGTPHKAMEDFGFFTWKACMNCTTTGEDHKTLTPIPPLFAISSLQQQCNIPMFFFPIFVPTQHRLLPAIGSLCIGSPET